MNWEYKGYTIEITQSGYFAVTFSGGVLHYSTLEEAKNNIDKVAKYSCVFTKEELIDMLKKLSWKELRFIKAVILELDRHIKSDLCKVDLLPGWDISDVLHYFK